MAQPVPHQATDKKRVKVYELRDNDWFDRGTGFCTATFATVRPAITSPMAAKTPDLKTNPTDFFWKRRFKRKMAFRSSKASPAHLDISTHRAYTDTPFLDTLIVWQEPRTGVDMALSFQEAEGCAIIWRFVSSIQQTFHNAMGGAGEGLSDDLAIEVPPTINLPKAELGNLPEIESSMRIMSSTANGRDALSKSIMADDYISKLIPLVEMAEDLESLSDLHRLCNIMKTIILLNDTSIIEHAVSDECVLGVVGALEYDPDFPSHKANHRHWLDNKGRYKEVVPIEDEQTRRKIHQTYRLQYLKDVVLARILDDPTFSVLNSLIFFNQVDIVQHLQSNSSFLADLFAIFASPVRNQKKRKEAVLFIQQCCGIAKNIQPPARQTLYNNFLSHGLLPVINFGLKHNDVEVRVGATDILVSIIDHDPQMIRQTIYRQMHENKPQLTDSLIELLLVEVDLGVKSQISEAIKVLLDLGPPNHPGPENFPKVNGEMNGRPRPQTAMDPQQEVFLTRFYERSAPNLFKPLLDLEHRTDMNFSPQQASMFSYLIEIMCFLVRQHHRFSRYFVLTNNITERVGQLLNSSEKFLQLVAIRFFRSLIGMQEEFLIKHLTEKAVLGPLLDVLISAVSRDNLLSSASLELFEYIKKENVKDLVKYLVSNYREKLLGLGHMSTFRDLLLRYDQTQGYTVNIDCFLEAEEDVGRRPPPTPTNRMMEHITMDPAEEEYWNTASDPEDEEDHGQERAGKSTANGSSTPLKPLVDYASDEEADEQAEGTPEKEKEGDDASSTSSGNDSTLSATGPPERIAEKRRREEADDDEIGKLMQNKRRNSSSSASNASVSSSVSRRRKSFTGVSGNNAPKISISLSPALRTGGGARSDEDS
ncbi:unnamed protein product [Clonostachys rhizophaga]|uniref:Serine/threonine-protein phosphatase 4 regulatory subunit 3-like central domain-containing protein n=1 Tax=Clonostachys rhizophaga TaxID=160324 RepID=A0A9N9V235_9HYPO|nr:unnamed protein product [Clonostachys rhizophaga]